MRRIGARAIIIDKMCEFDNLTAQFYHNLDHFAAYMEVRTTMGASKTAGETGLVDEILGHFQYIILGGGIVGAMIAWHLWQKGARSILLIEQGDIAGPGSTSHASNFIYPISHSRLSCWTTIYSMNFYKEMDLYSAVGGLEIATKDDWERIEELKRKHGSGMAFIGDDVSWFLSPAETKAQFPFLDESKLWNALWQPVAGLVHGSDVAAKRVVDEAREAGALTVMTNTKATGLEINKGRVQGVYTEKGFFTGETVIAALGVWGPILEKWTDGKVRVPLVCAYHPLMYAGDIPEIAQMYADTGEQISYPLLRHQSIACYMRQDRDEMEFGYYPRHPLPVKPSDQIREFDVRDIVTPTIEPLALHEVQDAMEEMGEVVPDMLDWGWRMSNKLKWFNGLLSHTVDGGSLVGEAYPGLWLAEAVWVKDAPGIAKMVADWLIDGDTEVDHRSIDINRLYGFQQSQYYVRGWRN